ncbi:MAG TPA: carboxymuconolactone decarboxylase family protein [Thermodesulfobacteriaceae bacterium]|nr:carboxymuconolactone decarboxylase family protein [Thermodesulfobacteriaceae bacterium]
MYTEMFNAFQNGSSLARATGPLDIKTTHLIQMAAAIGAHSEGAVHSHARRALEAGASHEELYQTVNLMISTLGFPAAAAAFSWINDIIKKD